MSFTLDLTRICAKSKVSLDETVNRFVFGMFSRIIMRSPVDTGRFRANWQISFNSISAQQLEQFDQGPVTANGSGQSSTKELVRAVLLGANWIGGKAYLVNTMPYGKYLEYGSSKQAPLGMVRLTVNEYAEVLDQARPYAL